MKHIKFIVALIIVALHFILSLNYISFENYFNDSPVINDDYPLHEYRILVLAKERKLWVYDPYFMAGYPLGAVEYGSKLLEIVSVVLNQINTIWIFKGFILFVYFSSVILFLYYVSNLKVSKKRETRYLLLSGLLFLFYWHLTLTLDGVSLRSFFCYGGVLFIFATFFSLVIFVNFYKMAKTQRKTIKEVLFIFLLIEISLLIHFESVFLWLPYVFSLAYFTKVFKDKNFFFFLGSLFAFFLLVNTVWIFDFISMIDYRTSSAQYFQIVTPFSFIFSSPLIFTIALCFFLCLKSWKNFSILEKSLAIEILFLFGISSVPIPITSNLQPLRFYMPGVIYAIPFASRYLVEKIGKNFSFRVSLLFFTFIFAIVHYALVSELQSEMFKKETFYPKLTTVVPKNAIRLIKFISENTTSEKRILIEDAGFGELGYGGHKFGGHFLSLFPLYTKREFIGGPHPAFPLKHHEVEFTNGKLLGKDIKEYGIDELKKILELYNIGWIIVYNETSKKVFENMPGIEKVKELGEFEIFKVNGNYSFFLEGNGYVHVSYGKIEISNITAFNNSIIIKYHCSPVMKVNSNALISCEKIPMDPIGFIKIKFNDYIPDKISIILS